MNSPPSHTYTHTPPQLPPPCLYAHPPEGRCGVTPCCFAAVCILYVIVSPACRVCAGAVWHSVALSSHSLRVSPAAGVVRTDVNGSEGTIEFGNGDDAKKALRDLDDTKFRTHTVQCLRNACEKR